MDLDQLKKVFLEELSSTSTIDLLLVLSTKYLGRRGIINGLFDDLVNKNQGAPLNDFKNFVKKSIDIKKKTLAGDKNKESIDLTLPGRTLTLGHLHLTTLAIADIWKIFETLGYERVSFGEVEWEYFAFDVLNMPPGHPARDDFETFFIDTAENDKYGRMLLTPHTSSGQVRYMKAAKSFPIKMINIGKCYRPNWDASHTPMFHQFEGLYVERGINITHLIGTIDYFVKNYFGEERKIRLRPYHFQFTEPSFEVDITCGVCLGEENVKGQKCRLCKSGWLELGGAGMVHPKVLTAAGVDPKKYSGWAFGFGIERVAMMKEAVKLDDLRLLYSNDIRFLEQF